MNLLQTAALLSLCFVVTACPLQADDGDPDAGGSDAGDMDGGSDGGVDGGGSDGGVDDGGTDAGRPGPFATCAEGSLNECFSNHDCLSAELCLNLGADPDFVPCCLPGTRGTLLAGETCDPITGETDCASSLCLEGSGGARCTDVCTTGTDCPTGMQDCTFIAFSGSSDQWCLFE